MALQSLQDLYVDQLRDLYNAEQQILTALPKMIEKSSHQALKNGFQTHLEQTREHVRRLEQIFRGLDETPKGEKCEGMEGLLKEGEKVMKKHGDSDVLDAAIIAAAQRVEHYEIAGYGCVRTYADALGRRDDAQLLQQTLDNEAATDEKLTQIAEQTVNPDAQAASPSAGRNVEREVTPGSVRERGGAAARNPGTAREGGTSAEM